LTTPAQLEPAFIGADYRVKLNHRRVTVHIGQRCPPALTDWLRQSNCRHGWIITAHNPGGQLVRPEHNRRRHDALCRAISRLGPPALDTRGVDPFGCWPDEPGLLVGGLGPTTARRLGLRFDQAAIVWVAIGRRTRLIWLMPHH